MAFSSLRQRFDEISEGAAGLALFTKYLQQLVMESLGKEKNLAGEIAHQGIAVYGNKGSTDQHSYVQQLPDGVLNFFVTFVEVRNDRRGARFEVEDGITSGDYLHGFLRGTRSALYEKGRTKKLWMTGFHPQNRRNPAAYAGQVF